MKWSELLKRLTEAGIKPETLIGRLEVDYVSTDTPLRVTKLLPTTKGQMVDIRNV